jgi:hypothetical protein
MSQRTPDSAPVERRADPSKGLVFELPWDARPFAGFERRLRKTFTKVRVVRDAHATRYLVRDKVTRGYALQVFPNSARPGTIRATMSVYSPVALFVEKMIAWIAAALAIVIVVLAGFLAASGPMPPSAWVLPAILVIAAACYFALLVVAAGLRRAVEAKLPPPQAPSVRRAADRLRAGLAASSDRSGIAAP